jgi:hypothetical protein
VTYTINGKEYSEFDINKRCAEILAWESEPHVKSVEFDRHNCFWVEHVGFSAFPVEHYLNNPADTWPIIEKCWVELMAIYDEFYCLTRWESIINTYNCTKLVAACICFIELKEQGDE